MSELICLGDSITDCNHLFEDYPLGNGYVRILAKKFVSDSGSFSQMEKKNASSRYNLSISASASANSITQVRNYGADGFTVARILDQISSFHIPLSSSSVVTLLVGINDIGLMMNTNRTEKQKQDMMQNFFVHYEQLLKLLIDRLYPQMPSDTEHPQIILMEPFIFPHPDEYMLWIPHIQTMSHGIGELARRYHTPYILLHDFFNAVAQKQGYDVITGDGIHLTPYGHQLLADRICHYCSLLSQ